MKNNSGFGWDPHTNLPTAPESVWDDIIAEHPQAKEFKTRPLIMYEELDQMFSGTAATGEYASYMASQVSQSRSPTLLESDYDSQAESVSTTNVNTGNDHDADSVDSDEKEDESTHAELSARACRRRGRTPRTSLTSTQEEFANEGSAKWYKSTGEKMTTFDTAACRSYVFIMSEEEHVFKKEIEAKTPALIACFPSDLGMWFATTGDGWLAKLRLR